MKGIIINTIIWVGIIAMLCFTIADPSSGFANVVSVAIWVLCLLAIFGGGMMLMFGYAATKIDTFTEAGAVNLRANLNKVFNRDTKPSTTRKAFGWVRIIAVAGLTAYSGLIVTAVVYLVSMMIFRLCLVIGEAMAADVMGDDGAAV